MMWPIVGQIAHTLENSARKLTTRRTHFDSISRISGLTTRNWRKKIETNKSQECKTRCLRNRHKPVPNNEHKSVAVGSILKTAALFAVAGKTARRTAMAFARAPRTRAPIPVLGTTASRCRASTLGPGECKNHSARINLEHATEKKRKLRRNVKNYLWSRVQCLNYTYSQSSLHFARENQIFQCQQLTQIMFSALDTPAPNSRSPPNILRSL